MPLDVAAFDAVLKDVYEKTVIDLMNSKIKALQMFSKETGTWEGRQVVYPLNVRRNEGVMATSESGTLPAAGSQIYALKQIPIRFVHGRIRLTAQVIKASRTSKGAFKRAMDQEMRGLVRDLTDDRNRMIWGAGLGNLALVNGAGTGTTTLNVDTPGGVAGGTNGARFLQVGMAIAIHDGTTVNAARQVNAIAADGASVTLDATVSAAQAADNNRISRAATTSTTALTDTAADREPMGLLGLVDDGGYVNVLHNINRSTYPIFQSYVFADTGALSADILQRGIDIADQRGQGEIKHLCCHHSVRRAYLSIHQADRRYTGADLRTADVGTAAAKLGDVTFGDLPWMVDKDAPYGMLFGIDPSTFTRWIEVEGEWADDDGTILLRVADVDAYEGRYRVFDNFSIDAPATCLRWDGIDTTIIVAHVV